MTETILLAALKIDELIVVAERPGRHVNIFRTAVPVIETYVPGAGIEGFMTSQGRFVGRKEAMEIALRSGQLVSNKTKRAHLISDDIW